jgi:hypothetical protein
MPKDHRRIATVDFERKIMEHSVALGYIAEVPLDTVIHVVQPTYVRYRDRRDPTGKIEHCWTDKGYLLYPFKINLGSFRCRVLGVEVPGHRADNLMKYEKSGLPCVEPLKFLDIRSWHPYRPEDAGLYMNWAALSEEAKRLLYGK